MIRLPGSDSPARCPSIGESSQRALFAARIRKAAEFGVETLATETGALVPDRPRDSYRNTRGSGFREVYVRPNYVPA